MKNENPIVSFDKTEITNSITVRPEKYSEIFNLKETPLIARGAGLSYCNAGASPQGLVIDMTRMNRILNFNPDSGEITVEAGMTVGDLNNFLISKGWILPVLPGYPFITIGGCIAFNIHGKSQFKIGTFGDWVTEIQLYHPEKKELTCSDLSNKDLLELSIGGMGLTGIILSAKLRLKKLPGKHLNIEKKFVANIYDAVKVMQEASDDYEYVYSWNNLNRTGKAFGEGVVYLEKYGPGNCSNIKYTNKLNKSYMLPSFHSRWSISAMCRIYYLLEKIKSNKKNSDIINGSFPIYGKEIYFHLFGKKGFREYQALFPFNTWEKAFEEIQKIISENKIAVALGSLKLFNGPQHNLSFSGAGVCITIDIQETSRSVKFFELLDNICISHKGIGNLSKDSRITGATAKKMFPGYALFKQQVNIFDINNCMSSSLKSRLNL